MNKTGMMTIESFSVSSFEKKCEWVIKNTTYLTSRETNDNKLYLYHTGQFFIEVRYSSRQKRVEWIQAFNNADELTTYAESITLEDLLG